MEAVTATPTPTPAVVAPTITSVAPPTGSARGGYAITITGTGFRSGAAVSLGSASCYAPFVRSATLITCSISGGASLATGPADVVVTNSDKLEAKLSGSFIVVPSLITVGVTRPVYAAKEVGTHDRDRMRYQFSHDADSAECAHGDRGYQPCETRTSELFTADDYEQRRVIRVRLRNTDGAEKILELDPALDLPGKTFHRCSVVLNGPVTKADFEAQLEAGPSAESPRIYCLGAGATVNAGGTTAITISQPNLHVVGVSDYPAVLSGVRLSAIGAENSNRLVNLKLVKAGTAVPLFVAGTSVKTAQNVLIHADGRSGILFSADQRMVFALLDSVLLGQGDDYYGIYLDANYARLVVKNSIISQDGLWYSPVYFRGFGGTLIIEDSTIAADRGYKDAVRVHQRHTVEIRRSKLRGCYAALTINVSNTVTLADNRFEKASDATCNVNAGAIEFVQPGNVVNETSVGPGNRACNQIGSLKAFAGFVVGETYSGTFSPANTPNGGNLASNIGNCQ